MHPRPPTAEKNADVNGALAQLASSVDKYNILINGMSPLDRFELPRNTIGAKRATFATLRKSLSQEYAISI